MAYDQYLADRVRDTLQQKHIESREIKMMGGLCWMVDEKMCVGIVGDSLMARVGTDAYAACLQIRHSREMNFTGRSMKGFVFVDARGIDTDEDLSDWVQRCLDFNPLAPRSKKRSKKKK